MNNNKLRFILIAVISSIILSTAAILFAQQTSEPDRKAIWKVLNELGQGMVREDIDSILGRLSPNMDKEECRKIKESLEEKFSKYDYSEYKFSPPEYRKIQVLEPGKKVKFKVRYSDAYKGTSGSGSSSGFTANFVMEKVNAEWLILDTDFYTKERVAKILALSAGFFVLLGILAFIFWLWMLIDCIKRDFPKPNDKIMWILLLIFIPVIGILIYYFIVKRKTKLQEK